MLSRLRRSLRRRSALAVGLLLVAFAAQGAAPMLAWCLHGGAEAHVASVVEPCHGAGEAGAHAAAHESAGHPSPHSGAPHSDATQGASHDHADCAAHHGTMAHVSAASDLASGLAPAAVALAPALVYWHVASPADAGPVSGDRAVQRLFPGGDPRPRLSGALPGVSTRLLI